jgi:hypothetical protein
MLQIAEAVLLFEGRSPLFNLNRHTTHEELTQRSLPLQLALKLQLELDQGLLSVHLVEAPLM